jgi:hypothetical protein
MGTNNPAVRPDAPIVRRRVRLFEKGDTNNPAVIPDARIVGPRGRPFEKGESGNPAGRPPGARNQATVAAEALLDGEAEALTRKAVELALGGDSKALRLCLDRILPPRRDRPIVVDLPALKETTDAPDAVSAIFAAVGAGQITPGEAAELIKLLDMFITAHEAVDKGLASEIRRDKEDEDRRFERAKRRRSGFGPY